MDNNIISMENVSFSYIDRDLLKGIDFTMKKKDYVLLTGENGSGKTTILRLLTGQLKANCGSIKIFGKRFERAVKEEAISYVPQNSIEKNRSFPATVMEIMLSGLYKEKGLFHFYGKKEKERVMEALRNINMEDMAYKRIGELSGGQQQRVMLARAMVGKPDLLILDEPSVGVDNESLELLYENLYNINKSGVSILMISHGDLSRIKGANRKLELREGRIKEL